MKWNFKENVLIKIFNTQNINMIITVIQKNHKKCVNVGNIQFMDIIVLRLHIYNQVVGFSNICDYINNANNDFEDLMKKFGFKKHHYAFMSHDETESCELDFSKRRIEMKKVKFLKSVL